MEEITSQIRFDENFIKKLLDKLKVGNTRSIHLNALPGRSATRLDLFQLSDVVEKYPQNFIDLLLNNESFSFEISYDKLDLGKLDDTEKNRLALISKRLNTIVIENNDNFLEFGIKNFGFGFPLLIKRDKNDPTKIIKAPLFIWNLDIERSYQNKNTWLIKRDEDSPIKINELLVSHLAKDELIQLEKISKEILEDGILDENELLELCNDILSQLNAKEKDIKVKIEKCPDVKQIEDIANSKPWIQWSGIFGIYLSQKETIIQSTEELLKNNEKFQNETLVLKRFQTSTISAIDTDPSKDEIINTLTNNEIKLIQGPPGTGKSQSITAIISNALANKAKCLIVCEKKTALDVIQNNLELIGLGKFSVIIDDVNKDRKKVIEKARNINEFKEFFCFSELEFNNKYENYSKIKKDINQKYAEPLKKIFGDFSWKHLVGLYLRFSKSNNFHYIKENLNDDFLKFTHDEYSHYLNIIEEASYIYEEIEKDSEIIFSPISSNIFNERFNFELLELIKYEIKTIIYFLDSKKILAHFNFFFNTKINCINFNKIQLVFSEKSKSSLILAQKHLDSYESFHNWKYFEGKRNHNELKILSVLKNIPSNEWKNIFKAWYYRNILLHYEQSSEIGFNKSDKKLQQLSDLQQELKSQQLVQIKHVWSKIRTDKLSSFTLNFNTLYNLRKNKEFNHRNSLRKIIETDFNLFTTLFPVILTNPSAVNALFPLQQGLFEFVIFDEASQLRISDTFTSLIRGQYKIIAGDKHQMPPSNYFQSNSEFLEEGNENEDIFTEDAEQAILAEAESLLQYAEDLNNINKSYLDYHYRSEHPALIEFSNCAFYGGNLVPFPAREIYKPIDFRSVNGVYDTRTNPSEVSEIIKIIQEEIHPNQKGKYPSLGIATFNINQRNLIIETLNYISEKDPQFAQKLQSLREQGLFVKNLENIQGDERDIIIISTTYGIKSDGKFSQNFARLNRIEGYKLLNVLITRAKKKLFICTSIPKEKYLSFQEIIQSEGNNKKGILYAYLTYAEAISNNDNETAEIVLKILLKQSYEKPRIMSQNDGLSESPFEEEVYQELLDCFDSKDIIQQYKVGGFRLDFLVNAKGKNIVLECDGKAYHQSDEAHAHDIYRQKELENMGFVVYRIWSTNWFQDKEIEMKKFLQFVSSLDINNI